jgi:hypothetical protein
MLPDRYDAVKILIVILVLGGVFCLGYMMKDTLVCRAWYNDQLYYFELQENKTLWDLFNNVSSPTITAGR